LLIKRWASLAGDDESGRSPQSTDYLNKIESLASESIDEARTIIQNLGPQNLRRFGLTESIVNIVEQVEDAFGIIFEKEIETVDGLLDEEAELSVYRMVQESVNNLVKHSGSPRGQLILKQENSMIVYSLSDFGIGIGDLRNKGNGLRNLEERTDLLGGTLSVESRKYGGTKVTIRIPARV